MKKRKKTKSLMWSIIFLSTSFVFLIITHFPIPASQNIGYFIGRLIAEIGIWLIVLVVIAYSIWRFGFQKNKSLLFIFSLLFFISSIFTLVNSVLKGYTSFLIKDSLEENITEEVTTPKLTYSTFTSEDESVAFIYPEEWIQISPAEIEKAIPAEAREKTSILMYAASSQNMILTASKTVSGPGETILEQTVAKVIEESRRVDPNLKEEYKDIKENEATVEIIYKLQGNVDWSARFKALLCHTAEEDILYIVQLTLPETLKDINQEVIETILSSFEIKK